MKNILRVEWTLFRRDPFALATWVLALLIGFYAIYYGHSFHQAQLNTITQLDTAYQGRIQRQLKNFTADTSTKEGKAAWVNAHDPFMNEWYTHAVVFKRPMPAQALSIGQSDNQPFYNNLWLYNDYVYVSGEQDLQNPDKLLSGNFDQAFVFIYLLPLLIIAYSYAVYGSDQENNTISLLLVQGTSLPAIVRGRLLFRFILLSALVIVLSISGFLLNHINDVSIWWLWIATSLLYLLFWFAVTYAAVSLKKSSAFTALLLVGVWIAFLMLIPSAINNGRRQQDTERVQLSDAEREYSIYLWELWQDKTNRLKDTLASVKPQWTSYPVNDSDLLNSVAYSYFDMLYINRMGRANDSIDALEQQRLDRFNFVNPAYATQQAFNNLSGTELYHYIDYRKAAAEYQQQRSEIIHELRLSGQPFTPKHFQSYPVFRQGTLNNSFAPWLLQVWPLILLTAILLAFANWRINKYADNQVR